MFPTIDWFYFQRRFIGEVKITVIRKNKMVSGCSYKKTESCICAEILVYLLEYLIFKLIHRFSKN